MDKHQRGAEPSSTKSCVGMYQPGESDCYRGLHWHGLPGARLGGYTSFPDEKVKI